MRKIKLLAFLVLFASIGFLTSCTKDKTGDTKPTITLKHDTGFVDGDVTLKTGELFKVGVNAAANATSGKNLVNFKVVRTFSNAAVTVLDSTINLASFIVQFSTKAVNAVGTEHWTFTITDNAGQSNESSFNITTIASSGEINSYTAVLLGGQENPNLGSFYSTLHDSVMPQGIANLNQARIDMIYYYGTTNYASIVAPASIQLSLVPQFNYILDGTNAAHWIVKNETKFKAVTINDWTLVTNDALITANAVDLIDVNVNNLAVGNTIAFETAATSANPGKKGLFKVIAMSGTSGADRRITIEVKIQK